MNHSQSLRAELRIIFFLLAVITVFLYSCDPKEDISQERDNSAAPVDSNQVTIEFTFIVDQDTYDYTVYGEPPQIAIWLEQPDSNQILTAWVSNRSGKNQWKGKVECPVALPYWESRHKLEKSAFQERNLLERLIDAFTGATPTGGEFSTTIRVPEGSNWRYFIEVNASGDYNKDYPYWSKDGLPDSEGNGQPSIVYSGSIIAVTGSSNAPVLQGRTEQRRPVTTLSPDLESIGSAKNLIRDIKLQIK